ncbi:MAG: GNAT family N-acetyltransferase [Bacteroidota bacterium]
MAIHIIPFSEELADDFRELNLAWIRKYFKVEEEDSRMLNYPAELIINKGGFIVFAVDEKVIVGTCALIKVDDNCFELAKMATREDYQGRGIGYSMGLALLKIAADAGAEKVMLDTNSSLKAALHLYEKLGFKYIPVAKEQQMRYERVDVMMEIILK